MAQTAGGYALEVLDLECVRGDVLVFEHLSFGVQQGQVLQILGANGSGKTSLLRMLVGLAAPAAGEIRWHGESILNTLDWTNRMLYQGIHNGFSASLTVSENLEYATAVAGRGTRMRVAEGLDRVGLAKHHGTLLGRLSSGQRQRVALARLMLIPADAWLLDEPLTALDRDGKHLLESMLSAHVNAGGIALVATHQPLDLSPGRLTTLDMDGRRAC